MKRATVETHLEQLTGMTVSQVYGQALMEHMDWDQETDLNSFSDGFLAAALLYGTLDDDESDDFDAEPIGPSPYVFEPVS